MNWQHHEPQTEGLVSVIDCGRDIDCPFELGLITTGKMRVFHRYYVKVVTPDGTDIIGTSEHSVREALLDVDRQFDERGLILLVAGTDPQFYESGLSWNSGYGYLPSVDHAVHMMDKPPPRLRDDENDLFVEGLIREAVAGMCNSPILASKRST
ncbi:MAG: hypothetical protein ACKOQ8_06640 [Micrococcales bacterium]